MRSSILPLSISLVLEGFRHGDPSGYTALLHSLTLSQPPPGATKSHTIFSFNRTQTDIFMDSESCTDKSQDERANKSNVEPSLGPITPDSSKESGDFPLFSSVTLIKKLPRVLSFTSKTNKSEDLFDNFSSPRTPEDGVFDPFAPGHEDNVLAPRCKKYYDEARASVGCRLNFTSSSRALRKWEFW
ncbi:CYCLIN-DEPENDENT PROTEIN KINASE INHIBITOR SMR11 [Salix koriyanagi]|uniref:CYCLIN-DEPENDENT PROTEIN KINASE INHIBITOR SMR11 n=1 Tax=Salix koriyanagi TaxID=2511006 RepID=A0A9Q0ZTX7_9ROSI|nr:CYCLIN-DEPENDENT PROTEIN KINASE INHIBITOR SMR11 [Salix koriyanagi]